MLNLRSRPAAGVTGGEFSKLAVPPTGKTTSARTTVSVGICLVGDGCFLTDAEVRERATKASAHAKEPEIDKPTKNCIATYRDGQFGRKTSTLPRRYDFGVSTIQPIKVALNDSQVRKLNFPPEVKAALCKGPFAKSLFNKFIALVSPP